ncbi:hypothetical protein HNQ40_003378 [Algisphaera agarilytica]|uniref:ATPase AAA-type core domain-containing protein n=1 Tax=Algisphaera agarilytica TaxID=1385975 RepID=A0A7X0H9H1_9BACT|nr:hypothetical protein [Algisphaera agarilytica]
MHFDLTFKIDGHVYRYIYDRHFNSNEDFELKESMEVNGQSIFDRKDLTITTELDGYRSIKLAEQTSAMEGLLALVPDDVQGLNTLRIAKGYLESVRYYPLAQRFEEHRMPRSPLITAQEFDAWFTDPEKSDRVRSVQFRIIAMSEHFPEKLEELQVILGDKGLGLISEIQVGKVEIPESESTSNLENKVNNHAYIVGFTPGYGIAGSERNFWALGLSAGTLRVLQLLTFLIYDESSCALMEQPEDSVHDGLLVKVIDVLKAYSHKTQLLCTTHSAGIMNSFDSTMIRLVSADERGLTNVNSLSESEVICAQQYLEDEGSLSEFLEGLQ